MNEDDKAWNGSAITFIAPAIFAVILVTILINVLFY